MSQLYRLKIGQFLFLLHDISKIAHDFADFTAI